MVTLYSTSQKIVLSHFGYLTSEIRFDTENDFQNGSPTQVLAKQNWFRLSVSLHQK